MGPRLVVLGCGFGGYSLLSQLPLRRWEATLVSPRNYFLFTPLLPSAAVGTVELRSILEPALRRLRPLRLLESEAVDVDWRERRVRCVSAIEPGLAFEVPFDHLVIAIGARANDFGIPGVARWAVPFYTLDDARRVRRRILELFAAAAVPGLSDEEVRRRLTFVVCGGGPTGVEVAAELHDLLVEELAAAYPELAPRARVVVVEALPRLLTSFDDALSSFAQRHFQREGIEVRTGTRVAAVEEGSVRLADGEEDLPAGLVVWAAGQGPPPLVERLDLAKSDRGRLLVDDHLRLLEHQDAYGLGDCSSLQGHPLPATAQVAQRQGKYLARALERRRRGLPVAPFDIRSSGMLAYIGGGRALADLPHVKWRGRSAWLFWRSAYLTKLVSLANKVKVLLDWANARLFGRDLSRFGS
jgi:NADH:ubiquinone reductase (non-electrogenic)